MGLPYVMSAQSMHCGTLPPHANGQILEDESHNLSLLPKQTSYKGVL